LCQSGTRKSSNLLFILPADSQQWGIETEELCRGDE
jgi:hypothetical protein